MKKHWQIIILFTLGAIVLSSNIWGSSIYILDEAKNATCAREMLDRNDLVVPTFNNELRTDKPPLHYYFMMLSYSMFGVNEFGARFFSVVAGIATLLITFFYSRKFLGYATAFWSVVILVSSIHFALEFHLAVPDPYLILFMTLSLFAFYDYYKTKKTFQLILFYTALGLGTLTKGPIATGLPGLIIIVFLLLNCDFKLKTIFSFRPLFGILLYSVIVLPWYVKVGIETQGAWLNGFFFKHNLERFSNSMEGHGGIFLIPLIYIFLGMLPFSVFIFRAFQNAWKKRKENNVHLYALSVVTVITIFFCISSTKLPNYTMPSYPFFAILIGYYLANFKHKNLKPYIIVSIIFGLIITAGAYVALGTEKELVSLKNYSLLFLVIPISCIVSFLFRTQHGKSLYLISAGWITASLLFFYVIFPKIDSKNPVSETLSITSDFDNIAYFGNFNPAFSFYVKKPIPRIDSIEEVNHFFSQSKNALLITTTKYEEQLQHLEGATEIIRTKDLFETPITLVYSKE